MRLTGYWLWVNSKGGYLYRQPISLHGLLRINTKSLYFTQENLLCETPINNSMNSWTLILGNELADIMAKAASSLREKTMLLTSFIWQLMCLNSSVYQKSGNCTLKNSRSLWATIHGSRTINKYQSLLAKLRTGLFIELRSYWSHTDRATDPFCPQYREHCPDTPLLRQTVAYISVREFQWK